MIHTIVVVYDDETRNATIKNNTLDNLSMVVILGLFLKEVLNKLDITITEEIKQNGQTK